ncbi:hypothetical protein I551_6771 [Mycobacterium ulcerans str. Harvey]|uniref:Uncharacterized protein n=1 Tax=Mycobacterium ulcerans str. Harvey TaxID=1299332 RepID=A0ABN0QPQ6_MYCUL|nr:hypothetical protein I551_6771 [Mycobacterium ulcerans str. Harvey]
MFVVVSRAGRSRPPCRRCPLCRLRPRWPAAAGTEAAGGAASTTRAPSARGPVEPSAPAWLNKMPP